MVRSFFSRVKRFLPFIGILIFIYTIYALDPSDIIEAIFSIPPIYILLAIPLTIPRVLIRNYAWKLIQEEQQITISYWQSLSIFLMGYFYGTITPGYLGQLMRIPYLKEKTGQPYGKLFFNSSIETIVHTMSLYMMMCVGAILVLGSFPELFTITVIWLVTLFIVLFIFVRRERGERIFQTIVSWFIPRSLKDPLYDFTGTFYTDFPRIKKLISPLVLGTFTWLLIFTQYYIMILALGLDIPYLFFLVLFPVANVASFIPISFAGLGTRELIAVVVFTTLFSVPDEKIFVVSLMGFLISDMLTGFIGFLVALRESGWDIMKKSVMTS